MSHISSVTLKGSISSPSTLQSLQNLKENLSEAGEKHATLRVATVYADVASQAWDLQGVFANLQTSQHLRKFYEQQTLFLNSYRAALEGIR